MKRRYLLAGAVVLSLVSSVAHAAMQAAFSQAAFETAQAANRPIVIAVHADWCPVCRAQKPVMGDLANRPEFKDLLILTVDFDAQKDVVKALQVQKQSTLIAFRGRMEKDRSVGVTDAAAITAMFQKTGG